MQTRSSAATSLPQLLPRSGRQSTNTQPSLSLSALQRKKPIIAFLHPAEELNSTNTEVSQPSGESPPSTAGLRGDFLGVIISSGLSFPLAAPMQAVQALHIPAQCQHKAPSMPKCAHTALGLDGNSHMAVFSFGCTKTRADESQINLKQTNKVQRWVIFLPRVRLRKLNASNYSSCQRTSTAKRKQ